MFEIAATRFEKGLFLLTLERKAPAWLAWAIHLGPLRGRFLGLALMLAGAFIGFPHVRIVTGVPLIVLKYGLFGLGLVVYAAIFLFRPEQLFLSFDRGKQELSLLHVPFWAKKASYQRLIPFRNLQKIQVHGPEREPKTPHGYMEILSAAPEGDAYGRLRFSFLSDEQFRIYHWNLSKLTGLDPEGDYQDPHPDLPSL